VSAPKAITKHDHGLRIGRLIVSAEIVAAQNSITAISEKEIAGNKLAQHGLTSPDLFQIPSAGRQSYAVFPSKD